MTLRQFVFLSLGLGLGCASLAMSLELMAEVTKTLWWPLGVGVVTGATILSRWWVARAAEGSPMGFVAAVNGSTAIKMLSLLTVISAYLILHKEGRVPYALGIFGVFAVQLVLFVWDTATLMRREKKNS